MAEAKKPQPPEGFQTAEIRWMRWSEVGDSIEGYYIDKDQTLNYNGDAYENVYTLQTDEGEIVNVQSRGKPFDQRMKRVPLGARVYMVYAEDRQTQGGMNPKKIIHIYFKQDDCIDVDPSPASGSDQSWQEGIEQIMDEGGKE